MGQMWPQLEIRGETEIAPKAQDLKGLLGSETFYESLAKIKSLAQDISSTYGTLYEKVHTYRTQQFESAVEKIKNRPEWEAVSEPMRQQLLQPLTSRCCGEMDLPEATMVCKSCGAALGQMESDLLAQVGLFAQVVAQIQKLTTDSKVKVERVRISEFFSGALDSEEKIKQAVGRLQDHLLKLWDEGIKIVVE